MMHCAASLTYATPSVVLLIRTGRICAPQATPATPAALFVAAAAAPATRVPWPAIGAQFVLSSTVFQPSSPRNTGVRSATEATPVSQTPMGTPAAVEASHA